MSSTTINLKVVDQTLTMIGTPVVASGGINEDYLVIGFDSSWDNLAKIAVFYKQKGEIYYSLVDAENKCIVPQEVIATKGFMYLGICGVYDDLQKTTQTIKYQITNGSLDSIEIEEPTPNIYMQIMTEVSNIRATAQQLLANEQAFEESIQSQFDEYKQEVPSIAESTATQIVNNLMGNYYTKDEVNSKILDKTLSTANDWVSSSSMYYHDLALSGLKVDDSVNIDLIVNDGASNLLNASSVTLSNLSNDNGVFTNTATDTKEHFEIKFQVYNADTSSYVDVGTIGSSSNNPIGLKTLTFTAPNVSTKFRILHNGASTSFSVEFNGVAIVKSTNYTVQLFIQANNPSTKGGLVFKKCMLQMGSSATTYQKYFSSYKDYCEDINEQWGNIFRGEVLANKIRLWSFELPDTNFDIAVKWFVK